VKIRQARKIAEKYWRWWGAMVRGRWYEPDFRFSSAVKASKRLIASGEKFLQSHRTDST
jgi:hypothetical protein